MRAVFVNLHKNSTYMRTLRIMISGSNSACKRRYILDYFINNNISVVNLITKNGCGLPSNIRYKIHNYHFIKCEAEYVFKKNNIPKGKIKNIIDPSEIRQDDIVLYSGTFLPEQFDNVSEVHGVKIVDHIHFYGNKEKAESLKKCGLQYYLFDVDLKKYSKLYQRNFSWFNGGYIMLPLTYQARFCVKTNFSGRKNKALAMGTLTKASFPDFIEAYGSEYYQPHRKMILDEADNFPEELDSYISEYIENQIKTISEKDSKINRTMKRLYNFYHIGRQKSYFSFNMVDKYNEYKMFICPEDVNGSYGVGTIEGMACGCAMIGWNYGAFEDMGMVAGKHYISYDGTMEDLIRKIRYYQEPDNQKELEQIAKMGSDFVRKNFSEQNVAQNILRVLTEISENERKNERCVEVDNQSYGENS